MFSIKNVIRSVQLFIILFFSAFLFIKPSMAATYTAGPSGTYSTIQDAIDAASGETGEPNEVRVQQGIYSENIDLLFTSDAGTIDITGGWNSTFTTRDTDYKLTTIDGGETDRVVNIDITTSGSIILTLDGFTLQNGDYNTYGSGILIEARNESQITINNNRILNNTSGTTASIAGGGIYAYYFHETDTGDHVFNITNNLIKGNSISSTTGGCTGAGIDLDFYQDAIFNVTGNIIEDNSATTDSSIEGVGVIIYKYGSGTCDFSDNIIRNNTANGTDQRLGIGGRIFITDSTTLTMYRNQWLNNIDNGGTYSCDLYLYAAGTSTLLVKDSLIAGADDDGVLYSAGSATSTIRMTNLTIVDNSDIGLNQSSTNPGTTSLYNSILYNNGTNYDTLPGDTGNNLIGTNPQFINSSNQNYHLKPGSPAINAGTNSPSGGLGSLDLDGKDRIFKSTVDIGAYEFYPAGNAGILMMLFN